MNKNLVVRLVLFLIDQLQDKGAEISAIRIIKYLYLTDYEYYRRNGEILTGINWFRYHYGPYFFEWPEVLQKADLDIKVEEIYTSKGKGRTFRVNEEQNVKDLFDESTLSMFNKILNRWSLENLDTLLDYVYFDTEPMQNAKFKEVLDFSKTNRKTNPYRLPMHIGLDKTESEKIQNLIKKKKSQPIQKLRSPVFDDFYFRVLSRMTDEDNLSMRISGNSHFSEGGLDAFTNEIE